MDALSNTATDRRPETARPAAAGPVGLSVVVPVLNEALQGRPLYIVADAIAAGRRLFREGTP